MRWHRGRPIEEIDHGSRTGRGFGGLGVTSSRCQDPATGNFVDCSTIQAAAAPTTTYAPPPAPPIVVGEGTRPGSTEFAIGTWPKPTSAERTQINSGKSKYGSVGWGKRSGANISASYVGMGGFIGGAYAKVNFTTSGDWWNFYRDGSFEKQWNWKTDQVKVLANKPSQLEQAYDATKTAIAALAKPAICAYATSQGAGALCAQQPSRSSVVEPPAQAGGSIGIGTIAIAAGVIGLALILKR